MSSANQAANRIALIVGAGTGSDVVPPVLELLDAAGSTLRFDRVDVSAATQDSPEDHLDEAVETVQKNGLGLKTRLAGSTRGADWHAGRNLATNPNVELRRRLDLFAGIRPIVSQRGLPSRYPDLDLLLVRENTEDIYKGIEHEVVDGLIQSLKVVTRSACERITHLAFELARSEGRKKVTFIHKANIMKRSDGLFRQVFHRIAEDYDDIESEDRIVDAACMHLVLDPYRFDVLLTGNLYGDIISSLGNGLAGGISNAHSINVGEDSRMFEAIYAPSEDSKEIGRANPLPMVSAALALLRHCDQADVADRIADSIGLVLESGDDLTPDLGGNATTRQMCDAMIAALASR